MAGAITPESSPGWQESFEDDFEAEVTKKNQDRIEAMERDRLAREEREVNEAKDAEERRKWKEERDKEINDRFDWEDGVLTLSEIGLKELDGSNISLAKEIVSEAKSRHGYSLQGRKEPPLTDMLEELWRKIRKDLVFFEARNADPVLAKCAEAFEAKRVASAPPKPPGLPRNSSLRDWEN